MKASTRKVYAILLDRKPHEIEELRELTGVKNIRAAISEIRNRHGAVIDTVDGGEDDGNCYILKKAGFEFDVPVTPGTYLEHFKAPKRRRPTVERVAVAPTPEIHTLLLTDLHFGAKSPTCDFGVTHRRFMEVVDKGFKFALQRNADLKRIEFDIGGDAIHGQGIYANQAWESAGPINEQLNVACDSIGQAVQAAREFYDEVVVNFVPGNHGRTSKNDDPNGSNWDLTLGMLVRQHLRGLKGVSVNVANNFYLVRDRFGHRFLLVHGHQGKGKGYPALRAVIPRWKQNPEFGGFDVVEHGHFHNWSVDNVQGTPVIASGTLQSGGDYGLANFGSPEDLLMAMIGTTKDSALEWIAPLKVST